MSSIDSVERSVERTPSYSQRNGSSGNVGQQIHCSRCTHLRKTNPKKKKKEEEEGKKKTPRHNNHQQQSTETSSLITALFTETGFSQTAKHLNGEITARTRPQAQKQ
jgi:hypothetical protein